MNRFNLTFSGEIVTGQEPEEVKQRFGKMFAIDDPVRLERFFCGETIILRRDLERKEAAHYFQEMRKLGAVGELVKVTASQAMNSVGSPPSPVHTTSPAAPGKQIEIAFAPKTPPPETDKADRAPATEPAPNPDPDPATASSGKNTKNQSAKTGKPRRQKKKVARPQRGLTPQQRKSAKKTAQHQARSVKAGREATEETERRQALLEEAVRKAGEAVRHKEHQREARLNAAEETAGQEAPGEETEAKAIEEDARQEPQREEARARSAEEVAREEAEAKAAEEVARKKAQREEAKRKAAEKAARQKAQREEAKRKTAEKAARQKAQREEAKRKTAEEAERRKAAEEAARQQALREEAERRKAAEEAARQQALREEAERKAAEEAARLQAELEEQRRREIEENARLEAELAEIERQEEEQAARLRAELEEKAREAAAEAARIKAVAEQKRQDAKSKSLARRRGTPHTKSTKSKQREKEKQQVAPQATKNKSEPVADKSKQVQDSARQQQESTPPAKAGPGHALQDTAAAGLTETSTPQPALKPLKGRVKTNLEVPQRITGQAAATQVKRKRQPGEPNLYQLRAFRNTQEVRGRAELAKRRMGQAFILGALALAGLLILGGSFLRRAPLLPVAGAEFIAINLQSGPVMLAAGQLLLHDRAGIGTEQVAVDTLGVSSLQAPMAFDGNGNLLAIGKLQDNNEPPAKEGLQLLRCDLTLRKCQQFSPQLAGTDIGALAINTIDNSLLLADRLTKELLKLDDQGEILLRAEIPMAEQPTLRLHSGLLFMNSTQGPAISVFRYDDKAFGQQLDEVLLLPPAAAELEQTRTGDFVWSGNAWWVSLLNPISGSVGLYRFSADWSYLDQVELSRGPGALRLNAWGEKTLVNDQQSIEVQRFNAQGGAEVPLVSGLLKDLVDGQRRRANSTALAWRTGLLLCAVLAAAGLCLGYLQRLRVLVYKSYRERGADPVDDHVESLQWIDPVDNRRGRLRRRGFSYALLSIALVLMGIGNSVSALQLAALFIVLSGPAVALVLWSRRPVGHIGILGQGLLLVDPRGIYHMGEGSQVHYRGSFLLIDDIVVFTGNRLLPAFSPQQVQGLVKPIAAGGIRVDFNTVLVKLLQSQHPLAQGVIAILATATTALVLLGLQGIF